MSKPKYCVATTSSIDYPVRVDIVQEVLGDLADISDEELPFRILSDKEENEYGKRLSKYDGILVRSGIFSEGLLKHLQSALIIAIHGAGVDQVDVKTAETLGIFVANAPGANANAVAELTIGLMIDLARRVSFSSYLIRKEGQWGEARYLGGELLGQKLGLIGYGQIGAKVAALARAFGMIIFAFDPNISEDIMREAGVIPCKTAEELMASSDIISLHIPHLPETYHFINEERIKSMRPGALLINTARGTLVDEKALYRALTSGHVRGAALDVLETEPPNRKNPLLSLDSVIVTPHLGGSTKEALKAVARIASGQIRSVLQGKSPSFVLNRPDPSKSKIKTMGRSHV